VCGQGIAKVRWIEPPLIGFLSFREERVGVLIGVTGLISKNGVK
jgi:hypothetical protein